MNYPLSNEELRAMAIPAEERAYQSSVDRLAEQTSRSVLAAAREGHTKVTNIHVLLPELPSAMLLRQVQKRFPQARVGYETKEGSELKLLYVDWS
jgi:hypothetical protein